MNNNEIIVVSIDTLKELISNGIKEELALFEQRIREALPEKKPTADRLYIKDVAEWLNISRPTVDSYREQGILPPSQFTAKNRPYWTREQIRESLKATGYAWKYDL